MKRLVTQLLLSVVLTAVVGCAVPVAAQSSGCGEQAPSGPPATGNIDVRSGSQPGEAIISWNHVPAATHYRIGYVNMQTDYPLAKASKTGCWVEAFVYADVEAQNFTATNGRVEYTVRRLEQGVRHAFTVRTGNNPNGAFTWPSNPRWTFHEVADWGGACPTVVAPPSASATPSPTPYPTPTRAPIAGGDYDADDDGLIEVANLAQLNAVRWDADGDGVSNNDGYANAFPNAAKGMGCPKEGCKGYELVASLDFDTNGNGQGDTGDDYWNDGAGWEPIASFGIRFGIDNFYSDYTFDGNGYTVANLYIDRPDADYVGLFSFNWGTIRNVVLDGVDVNGNNSVGSLVGLNQLTVQNSSSSGRVSGRNVVGGLVGITAGTINSSSSSSMVTGSNTIGGLVGVGRSIFNSTASGPIAGDNVLGGLVGYTYPFGVAIKGSTASGTVSGKNAVGGLVGQNGGHIAADAEGVSAFHSVTREMATYVGTARWSIVSSMASGTVSGNDYVGGLVGRSKGTIKDSVASGNVTGNDYVGGSVGRHEWFSIEANAASGEVSGNDGVGGLIGVNYDGYISASYATGNVTSQGNSVGGLVGYNDGDVSDSYATSKVSGQYGVGGLVGYEYGARGKISTSYAAGSVSGKDYIGGLIGTGRALGGGPKVVDSYWDTETSGQSHSAGGQGKTTVELQVPTGNTGIYTDWSSDHWDFGTSSQYPALKSEGFSVSEQRQH